MSVVRRWLLPTSGLLLLLWYLRAPSIDPIDDYHIAMGTMVRMTLYADPADATAMVEAGREAIAAIETMASHYDSSSELSHINRTAGRGPVAVSSTMSELLHETWHRTQQSGGHFDPALGLLTSAWGFPEAVQPPEAQRVAQGREHSGFHLVDWIGEKIRFLDPMVRLDLGAAAKGFAVDQAVKQLQQAGVAAGMIEAGGDIRFWGVKPDGKPWRFGVQHPRESERILVIDDIGLPALATSGDYEQFFDFEDRRFHHLLDPQTGYPARRAVSATVWSTSAAAADIMASAAFVGGPQVALQMAAADDSLEVLVFYEKDGRLQRVVSDGVRAHIQGDV